MLLLYLLVVLYVDSSSSTNNTSSLDQQCPLWTSPQNGSCKCGNDLRGIVKCEDGRGAYALTNCFCMTTTESPDFFIVGPCLYTCLLSRNMSYDLSAKANVKNLSSKTCKPLNRADTMCGKCIDEDHGLPAYSYNLSCVNCTDYKYNWLKYIAVAYGPLTVFFCVIIVFRISVTSGLMVGYVTVSQMITTVGLATQIFYMTQQNTLRFFTKLGLTLMSIWNLDFFRSLYPPFCLHPHLSALQVLSLDYIIAVYPMILVLLTYLFVKLHDHFRLVVWLCRPAYTCFRHFRKEWNIKTSLIGAFATFFLLSYVKILDISAHLLTPTYFYHMNGSHGKFFFFYNGTMHYFGKEHLPYAALAITLTLLLNILPLVLLCLYPCPCFQRCLSKSKYQWHVLRTFMDAILGSYSHRSRERRYFTALYLVLRILHVAAFVLINSLLYPSAACCIWMSAIVTVAIFRPYRKQYLNAMDVILFSLTIFVYLILICYLEGMLVNPIETYNTVSKVCLFAAYSSLTILMTYGFSLTIWKILPHKFIRRQITVAYIKFRSWKGKNYANVIEESLPYRLEHDHNERHSLLTDGVVQYFT